LRFASLIASLIDSLIASLLPSQLNSVLNEEITPTLERLRGEKQHYLKWSKNNADIERIERFCVAYDFSKCQKTLSTSKEEVVVMKGKIEDLNSKAAEHAIEVTKRNEAIETIKLSVSGELEEEVRTNKRRSKRYRRDNHHSANAPPPQLQACKTTEENISKDLVKVNSALQNATKVAGDSDVAITKAEAAVVTAEKAVELKNDAIVQDAKDSEVIKTEAEAAEKEYAR
jgi:structural maintenance of chromosome 2